MAGCGQAALGARSPKADTSRRAYERPDGRERRIEIDSGLRATNQPASHLRPRELCLVAAGDRARMPYELAGTLDALAELDPRVKEMAEYRRLKDLLD